MYRLRNGRLEILLVHLGGPFWAKKDAGAWTFPRGEIAEGEEPLTAAIREFEEETGHTPRGPFKPLGQIKHKSRKIIHAWAFEGDCEPAALKSNTFELEWPPKSGQFRQFPEVDRAEFFDFEEAIHKIFPSEIPLLEALQPEAQ